MKEFKTPLDSFIGGWYIPEKVCDDLILFQKNHLNELIKGECNHEGERKANPKLKDSLDLHVSFDNYDPPLNIYREYLQQCLEKYVERYPILINSDFFNVNTNYNIQYYPPGGGFKFWHCESAGKKTAFRNLVFMTYLNNVENAGTKFKYQKITTPCVKGLTFIWPSAFTHTHKGVVNEEKEKYIVTGWYTYK
tara:strand:- start:69 stop:647 length:579 start_codon:yes stop_codon:yes gene_type:complete